MHIQNVRCFADNTISFAPASDSPFDGAMSAVSWTLILGNNGTGKTTLLRCIAIAASSETSASGLLRELNGPMIRADSNEATIDAEFVDAEDLARYRSKTRIIRSEEGEEELKREDSSESTRHRRMFLCGYGANRTSIGANAPDRYSLIDAVYSLFNYDSAQLSEPETILHRLIRNGWDEEKLLSHIDRILLLPSGSTRLTETGIQISGSWGRYVPFGGLGDGYVALLSLLVDMLGWYAVFKGGQGLSGPIRGMVLIDEIEQHLHPSWQKRIVSLFCEIFPNIQFLGTTHAPVVATGAGDLSQNQCRVILCQGTRDGVHCQDDVFPPRHRRADQVLTSSLFGLRSTASRTANDDIHRLAELQKKTALSSEEAREMEELRQKLDGLLGGESEEGDILRRALDRALESILEDKLEGYDQDTARLELKRQISQIFGDEV